MLCSTDSALNIRRLQRSGMIWSFTRIHARTVRICFRQANNVSDRGSTSSQALLGQGLSALVRAYREQRMLQVQRHRQPKVSRPAGMVAIPVR